jgi:hypothetical protein
MIESAFILLGDKFLVLENLNFQINAIYLQRVSCTTGCTTGLWSLTFRPSFR